jgi:trimethylamine:corrinoid methyltransferase-like protein
MFAGIDFKGDFLKQKITRQLFRQEQHLPSAVIERGSVRSWQAAGSSDTFQRAKVRVDELLAGYERPSIPPAQEQALRQMMNNLAAQAQNTEELPE